MIEGSLDDVENDGVVSPSSLLDQLARKEASEPAELDPVDELASVTPASTDSSSFSVVQPQLSRPLGFLFAINGATLALPMTALLYLINTRVALPLELIPTYAALSFLPFSLQPIYAYLSTSCRIGNRHYLLATLLLASAVFMYATSWIPPGGIMLCLLFGFLRGIGSAWTDFLLGLTLIEEAQQLSPPPLPQQQQQQGETLEYNDTSTTTTMSGPNDPDRFSPSVAFLQAQAATCRNLGSFLAHVMATIGLAVLTNTDPSYESATSSSSSSSLHQTGSAMSSWSANVLFMMASLLNVIGSLVAWNARVGTTTTAATTTTTTVGHRATETAIPTCHDDDELVHSNRSYHSFAPYLPPVVTNGDDSVPQDSLSQPLLHTSENPSTIPPRSCARPRTTSNNFSCSNDMILLWLQICMIWLILEDPIVKVSSQRIWGMLSALAVLFLVVIGCCTIQSTRRMKWRRAHWVGLFLILRHAIPSSSLLLDSYLYSLYESRPSILQVTTLCNMGVLTLASWSYGRVWTFTSRGTRLELVIAGTTALAALASGSQLILVWVVPKQLSLALKVVVTLLVQCLTTLTGEWMFLPDIILATVSAAAEHREVHVRDDDNDNNSIPVDRNGSEPSQPRGGDHDEASSCRIGLQYGALISCINLGDQIGSLLTGPLVTLLHIRRGDHWENLDHLIEIEVFVTLFSIALIGLLTTKS